MSTRKLWIGFIAVMVISFSVLLYFGREIYRQAPPVPEKVIKQDGTVLFTGQDIKDGQNVWQSLGGQEIGTVWGHGAYQAPDWSADWLHKEAVYILNQLALKQDGIPYTDLSEERKAFLKIILQKDLRKRSGAGWFARCIQHPGKFAQGSCKSTSPECFFLLGIMGLCHRTSRPGDHIHQQLAF